MQQTLTAIDVTTIDGQTVPFRQWIGEVLLVVNVASACGLTPQYAQLESLYRQYHEQGFAVLGFPCNQFLGQEPGNEAEIRHFCDTHYGVTFPLFSKIDVNGEHRHPLYAVLTADAPTAHFPEGSGFLERMISKGRGPQHPGDILWNFEKFLIDRHGHVLQRFSPDTQPDDPELVAALTAALAQQV